MLTEDPVAKTARFHFARVAEIALTEDSTFGQSREPTKEQVAAVGRSNLGRLLMRLGSCATSSEASADYLMSLGVRFFASNGMRARFPRKKNAVTKLADTASDADLSYLDNLRLWVSPVLGPAVGRESTNALYRLDKDDLCSLAAEFYQTGCRCIWFERMLVESIIAAEAYAFTEELRSNAYLISGKSSVVLNLLVSIAYEYSKGASPRYEIYVTLAKLLYGVLRILLVVAIAVYSVHLIDTGREFAGYVLAAISGLTAINIAGQFVTNRIVRWVRSASGDAMSWLAGFKLTALAQDARSVHAQSAHSNMNPALVRSLLRDCVSRGFVIDPIVFSFLDRAIVNSEHRWASWYEKPVGWDYEPEYEALEQA